MTTIRLKGVKSFVKGGITYYYLRKTGVRIADPLTHKPIDPATHLADFTRRLEDMRAELVALPAALPAKAATLEDLVHHWRGRPGKNGQPGREPSPDWLRLSPATRTSYDRVIDPEEGHIRKALKRPLNTVPLHLITTPWCVRLRDKVAKRAGFWFGNYTIKVLRPAFKWGNLYGHMVGNPAKDIPELERPEDMPDQHRGWAALEYEAMYAGAIERGWEGIALALGLSRWAGWATGDICHQPPEAWQDPRIAFIRRKGRKKKRVTDMLAAAPLATILRDIDPDMDARTLVTNEQGEPYTEDGLRSMIWKLCKDLVDEGKVKPGLTIHGLRHSLGKQLYDLGIEREGRKAVMSHKSDAASIVYERDGNRSAKADAAIVVLNRSLRKRKK
jgi:hypothetical protein